MKDYKRKKVTSSNNLAVQTLNLRKHQQILTLKKLQPENVWRFCLKKWLINFVSVPITLLIINKIFFLEFTCKKV